MDHILGTVDDCTRCINCEIGAWNAWQRPVCPAGPKADAEAEAEWSREVAAEQAQQDALFADWGW